MSRSYNSVSRKRKTATSSANIKPENASAKNSAEPIASFSAPGSLNIYDRNVNLNALPHDASLYSLLKAWVQDDVSRIVQKQANGGKFVQLSFDDLDLMMADHLMGYLTNRHERSNFRFIDILNSLESVSNHDILSQHVANFKATKRVWHQVVALKYKQYRERLEQKGLSAHYVMENLLHENHTRSIRALRGRLALTLNKNSDHDVSP